jgi:hypothetical protein
MLFYIFIIFLLLIYIFFIVNSVIWLKDKNIKNINDNIVKYIIYIDLVFFSILLLFILYLFFYNKTIIYK